nr:MAG TPA: hypothetical protein [Caudoviricetes sp.]
MSFYQSKPTQNGLFVVGLLLHLKCLDKSNPLCPGVVKIYTMS